MDWMTQLSREDNTDEFSLLVHNYFKLSVMRIMQTMREKYDVPEEDIQTLVVSIFARMFNESCYAIGSQIKLDYPITSIFKEEHIVRLLKILSGEPLSQHDRNDIDLGTSLENFKKFVAEHGYKFNIIQDE